MLLRKDSWMQWAKKREDLSIPKKRKHAQKDHVRFITSFNGRWRDTREAMKKHWRILQMDPIIRKYIPSFPSTTYRRSRNLRDRLVHRNHEGTSLRNVFGSSDPKGSCSPGGSCVACPNIEKTTTFSNCSNTKIFTIRKHITCGSEGVIYCATCPCTLMYIGLTSRKLKIHTREHVSIGRYPT